MGLLDPRNAASLADIRSSSFMLNLDTDVDPLNTDHRHEIMAKVSAPFDALLLRLWKGELCQSALHILLGGGPDMQQANRWYDRTLQVHPLFPQLCRRAEKGATLSSSSWWRTTG